ncbi:alpha/beta hydrolase family esterase [Corynebacterium suicordis]
MCLASVLVVTSGYIGARVQMATGWPKTVSAQEALEPGETAESTEDAVPRVPESEQPDIMPVARSSNGQVPLQDAPKPGTSGHIWVDTNGERRPAYVQIPQTAAEGKPTPVVLAFHGYQEKPETMAAYSGLGKAWGKDGGDGAIVVYPEGKNKAWEGAPYAETAHGQDVQFVRDLLDRLSATYPVDATRIYAAGMSNGGGFGLKLACEMPEHFAAIASVSGAYYPGTWRNCATKQSDPNNPERITFTKGPALPFLEIHGGLDSTISFKGGTRHGSPYLSAMRLSSLYAARTACFGAPVAVKVSEEVNRTEWTGCDQDAEVMQVDIVNAEHTWPGETKGYSGTGEALNRPATVAGGQGQRTTEVISATSEVLAFFERHRLDVDARTAPAKG